MSEGLNKKPPRPRDNRFSEVEPPEDPHLTKIKTVEATIKNLSNQQLMIEEQIQHFRSLLVNLKQQDPLSAPKLEIPSDNEAFAFTFTTHLWGSKLVSPVVKVLIIPDNKSVVKEFGGSTNYYKAVIENISGREITSFIHLDYLGGRSNYHVHYDK